MIDSLEPGGAERMAVNYANALHQKLGFAALVATRAEGDLKQQLENGVVYQYLARKRVMDWKSLALLRKMVKQHKITHIQAHSSSIFFAVLLKIVYPSITIIWHDHYGNSENIQYRPKQALQWSSLFVKQIVVVNEILGHWSKQNLWCKQVLFLPNFTIATETQIAEATILKGLKDKRIVCLANLRPQKNHKLLLEVANIVHSQHPDWTFHLIGKDFQDNYAKEIKETIVKLKLENIVFIYGSKSDINNILEQSTIGVLTSNSEGLPVAILEYARKGLPVVATNVGQIATVLEGGEAGALVASGNTDDFVKELMRLIENKDLQIEWATKLKEKVNRDFGVDTVINAYLKQL
ncbi:glycosyltransferase [Flavobacterium chuncheonense]|uniref:Glycosyltransferase n=1 Tax=Flavobacterium chuncheonense TaxID=2026653 RepID=A0ABW5YJ36_9FLAO